MIFVYCDGSIVPKNPGGWAVGGFVIKSETGELLAKGTHDLGQHAETTNNRAEHVAVWAALQRVIELGLTGPITVRTDSQLIVNQLSGRWGCAEPTLLRFRDATLELVNRARLRVTYEWIPRAQNHEADAVSRSLYHGRTTPGLPEPEVKKRKRGA